MMAQVNEIDGVVDERVFPVRTIDMHDLRIALAQGWQDFLAKRGDLIFVGLIYPIVIFLSIMIVQQASVLPLVFPLVAGSVVFGPAVASGYYELARRRELGLDSRWRHFLDAVRGPAGPALAGLTSVTVLLFLLWVLAAWLIYGATVGALQPEGFASVRHFLQTVFGTAEGWTMIIVGNLVGLAFVVVALAVSMVSFPMVVDRKADWGIAMRTSIRVARRNPFTSAVWGLIVVVLTILGTLPAFVGLAVVFPVLGYATWHLYTRAVVR